MNSFSHEDEDDYLQKKEKKSYSRSRSRIKNHNYIEKKKSHKKERRNGHRQHHYHHKNRSNCSETRHYRNYYYKPHRYESSSESKERRRKEEKKRKQRNHHYHYNEKKYERSNSSYHRKSYKSEKYKNNKKHEKYDSEDGKDRSKDAGHFQYTLGQIIDGKYKILRHLSDGTFGRVFEILNLKDDKTYAMKVIRSVERYIDSAKTECEILEHIRKLDVKNENHIVMLIDKFHYKANYFMIFEKLGSSLYDVLKKNNYKGFPIDLVQSFLKQTLESIGFLHSNGLTHTDLKPENILLLRDKFKCLEKELSNLSSDDGRSSTCSTSKKQKYYIPTDDRIKIIDFGGATYDYEHHSNIINTRQYRAPEVILASCSWGHVSDVWCMACIALELYSGDLFFETHDSYEHLAMIEKACGPIPAWMFLDSDDDIKKHFKYDEGRFQKYGTYYDWPKYCDDDLKIEKVKEFKKIEEIIDKEHPDLIDLMKQMLIIDPKKRITCEEALKHNFFKRKYEPSS